MIRPVAAQLSIRQTAKHTKHCLAFWRGYHLLVLAAWSVIEVNRASDLSLHFLLCIK